MQVAAVVTAAGAGVRFGGRRPKQFLTLAGESLLVRALRSLEESGVVEAIVAVVPAEHLPLARRLIALAGLRTCLEPIAGGARRQDSVMAGFFHLPPARVVLIHDGARPLVTPDLVRRCAAAASEYGAALAAVQPAETVKYSTDGRLVDHTVDRRHVWMAQTPQAFRTELLARAYAAVDTDTLFTDEASLVEAAGFPVQIVRGDPSNLKITSPADLVLARALLRARRPAPVEAS